MQRADFDELDAEEHGLKSFPPSWKGRDDFTITGKICQWWKLEMELIANPQWQGFPENPRRFKKQKGMARGHPWIVPTNLFDYLC